MSRQSPTGFLFSIVFEIAVVVAIVSFLPRVDLRPRAEASGAMLPQAIAMQPPAPDASITPVGWTDANRGAQPPSPQETSYYQRPASPPPQIVTATPAPTRQAPTLFPAPPADPAYVEQRLDRASQQLVNTVGTAVSNTASNILNYSPPPAASTLPPSPTAPPQNFAGAASAPPQLNFEQPPAKPARRFMTQLPGQQSSTQQPQSQSMRPWLRY